MCKNHVTVVEWHVRVFFESLVRGLITRFWLRFSTPPSGGVGVQSKWPWPRLFVYGLLKLCAGPTDVVEKPVQKPVQKSGGHLLLVVELLFPIVSVSLF